MKKIKTLIVDDEKKSRDGLKELISKHPAIELIDTCRNGVEAIESIEKWRPELLLLDIQMPGISGFDILKSISYKPITIFITAFDQYALKAFEVHALDYLLKPFTNSRFNKSLNNAIDIIRNNHQKKSIDALQKMIDSLDQSSKFDEKIHSSYKSNKLIIRFEGRIELIDYERIIWIEGYDYYVKIYCAKTYIIKDSLKNLSDSLPDFFFRVHKSSIINLQHLVSLESIGHSEMMATLSGSVQVKVSRNCKDQLMKKLQDH
ncbi:LytR/AlgR family response regulator transcription factor [Ekhidna sp. To15]|uniref:LytR/AlgR family response regulator transcription factor n=1 Tax=Ekhidna sp. To15 TaxID=3395267 RepID=UPI003F51D196